MLHPHLPASEKRLAPLREHRGAALPGQALVVYDPDSGLVTDIVASEDAHQSERASVAPLLDSAQPGQLWIADRYFCTRVIMQGWAIPAQRCWALPCRSWPTMSWLCCSAAWSGRTKNRSRRQRVPPTTWPCTSGAATRACSSRYRPSNGDPTGLAERLLRLARNIDPRQVATSKRGPKVAKPKEYVDGVVARAHVSTARVLAQAWTTP